ncbi:cysteine desulfurase [bacterium]|jgi:cysteine desulfurase|nr:cysteine desulfurase [bacterium]
MDNIYFDYNATHPVLPQVRDYLIECLSEYGNPSSVHSLGRAARDLIEETREVIAKHLGVSHKEIFFTSGGSEANHLTLRGLASSLRRKRCDFQILFTGIEHSSLLGAVKQASVEGAMIQKVPVDAHGVVEMNHLCDFLKESKVLTLMAANNETGVKMPIHEVSKKCREAGVIFHSDCVQQFGKAPLDLTGVDLATFSGHKIGASKGIGFLYKSSLVEIDSLNPGGSQERELRPGTENVWGILSLKAAVEALSKESELERIESMRDHFESRVKEEIQDVRINSLGTERMGNTSSITFFKCQGESLLFSLDLEGMCVSMGSACASGSVKPSHVLVEMGMDEKEARSSMRFSFGRFNDMEQIDQLVEKLKICCSRQRKSD